MIVKIANRWKGLLALGALVLAAAPAWGQVPEGGVVTHDNWWLPVQAAAESRLVDTMFSVIFVVTSVTMVAVFVVMTLFLIKYRHREGRRATFIHGNHQAEMIWTVTPAVILVVMGILSIRAWGQLRMNKPGPEVEATDIEVLAQQFQWNFRYPGKDGKFGTRDDIGTFDMSDQEKSPIIGTFYVPVDKPVRVHLMSKDVLHSFFLPNVRMKLDAVPGLRGDLWFTPTRVGRYDLACAELCGPQHYTMRGEMVVMSQEDYSAWLKERMSEIADLIGEEAEPSEEPKEAPEEEKKEPEKTEAKETPAAEPAKAPGSGEPVISELAEEGVIKGRVLFDGTPPRAKKVSVEADAHCKKAHPAGLETQSVKVKDGGLADVFVQIKSGLPKDGKWEVPGEPVVLNQEGCEYHPHVFGIMAGQPLKVVNNDSTNHNIHGFPKLNQQFNFSQAQKGMEKIVELGKPENFQIRCDVHNWMQSHAFVMPHPFFATTDESGSFEIKNVPPGTYVIEFWHESLGTRTAREVKIESGKGVTAEVTFAMKKK